MNCINRKNNFSGPSCCFSAGWEVSSWIIWRPLWLRNNSVLSNGISHSYWHFARWKRWSLWISHTNRLPAQWITFAEKMIMHLQAAVSRWIGSSLHLHYYIHVAGDSAHFKILLVGFRNDLLDRHGRYASTSHGHSKLVCPRGGWLLVNRTEIILAYFVK